MGMLEEARAIIAEGHKAISEGDPDGVASALTQLASKLRRASRGENPEEITLSEADLAALDRLTTELMAFLPNFEEYPKGRVKVSLNARTCALIAYIIEDWTIDYRDRNGMWSPDSAQFYPEATGEGASPPPQEAGQDPGAGDQVAVSPPVGASES